jgi:hypothetical protein
LQNIQAALVEENIVEGADIEKVPHNMEGTEAIIINGLQKSFTGINKKTVHAVQVIIRNLFKT